MKHVFNYITILICLIPLGLKAQSQVQTLAVGDSLTLVDVIKKVIANYPSVKKAELEIEAADAKIGLAKSVYFPNVGFSASYTNIGPNPSLTLPELGTFSLSTPNNLVAALEVNQQIYDFGKTSKNVTLENQAKALSQLSLEQLKQKLSRSLLGSYYAIVYLQEAIHIKDEELKTLNEHLMFVQKKADTGSSIQYEVLTTQVKISNIENQKTDLLTNLKVQQSQLNSFLGQPQRASLNLKEEIHEPEMIEDDDILISKALNQRDELRIARQRSLIYDTRLKLVNAANNPSFSFFASGGFRNGYVPDLNVLKGDYAVGVGFKLPIFDGTKTKFNRALAQTDIRSVAQDTELARRNIEEEVVECRANVVASLKKVSQSELQLRQAKLAYSLAETSFNAGTITNLDMLDSSTSLAESRLAVMKSHIDYTVSLLNLKIALGERMY